MLKFTNKRSLQKEQTIERNNFKKNNKKLKRFNYKYKLLLIRQDKKRNYYNTKIKEYKSKLSIKTRNNIKGKTKKQINKIWLNYRIKKEKLKYKPNIKYIYIKNNSVYENYNLTYDKKLNRFYFNLGMNFENLYNILEYIKTYKNKIRTILFYVSWLDSNLQKHSNSQTFPYSAIGININKFFNWLNTALKYISKWSSNYEGEKFNEFTLIIYEVSENKNNK